MSKNIVVTTLVYIGFLDGPGSTAKQAVYTW